MTTLHHATGPEVLPTMISTSMCGGERVYHRQAGGGGWGDPLRRPPARVADDVRNDKVSVAAALKEYGVVVNEETFEVDEVATAKLRGSRGLDL